MTIVFKSHAIVFIVGLLAACGPAHLVQELGYKSDVDKMVVQVKASQEQCRQEMQTPDLDPIRQKVELARVLADKDPPAFALLSNDKVPTEAEQPVIAKWAALRDICVKRANALRTTPSSANANEKQTFQQQMSIGSDYTAKIGELILLLYRQKMTYGEFAQKQYEFSRDDMTAVTAFTQAIIARDDDRQAVVLQQFAATVKAWTDYIRVVSDRQPMSRQ